MTKALEVGDRMKVLKWDRLGIPGAVLATCAGGFLDRAHHSELLD
jgi:hypothetical protein